MIGINFSNVDAAGTYSRPKAGGYVAKITRVVNDKAKERLDIEFDFAGGEFAGYYQDLYARRGFWAGKFSKSYKEKALPFFKGFIEAVVASNPNTDGLVIGDFEDVDETKLVGLAVGMVVGEKEYIGNDGIKKVKLDVYNAKFVPASNIASGNFEVPELIPLEEYPAAQNTTEVVDTTADFGPVNDDDMPF